ncbi:MAG: amidohydrolase family protein [Thermodesulfobacteriota bacterium]
MRQMPTWVRAGNLLDGSGGPAKKDAVFAVRDGRFGPVQDGLPAEVRPQDVLDLSGCTVLPGLADCHAHLLWSGTRDREVRDRQMFPEKAQGFATIEKNCEDFLRAGVLCVRDGGDPLRMVLDFLEERGCPPGLVVQSPGPALHSPGRYGKIIGRPVAGDRLAWDILQNGRGRHHVKIVQSGLNSLTSFGKQSAHQYRLTDLRAAVGAARGRGLPVMAHANGELPVAIAVEAGVASIEHGFFMGRENLRRMAEKGTVWVPTAVTMQGYAETLPQGDPRVAVALKILENQVEAMAAAREMGVAMAVGTDAGSQGVFHGAGLCREMALFCRAGFSISQAVAAATAAGARLMGFSDRGRIREGFRAGFVAVAGEPEGLLAALDTPHMVAAEGVVVFSAQGSGQDLFAEK